ncbi:MAG: hypothetical protein O7H41_19710 [Planctomycetota bacterium]|nr:hypothetical protein [Planctomycetota bacterium]
MTPILTPADAALLEATEDPPAYFERFLVICYMDTLERSFSCRSVFPRPGVYLVVGQDLQPN